MEYEEDSELEGDSETDPSSTAPYVNIGKKRTGDSLHSTQASKRTMSTKDMQHKSQLNTQQQYRHDGNTGNTTDCIVKMNEAGCIGENLISN